MDQDQAKDLAKDLWKRWHLNPPKDWPGDTYQPRTPTRYMTPEHWAQGTDYHPHPAAFWLPLHLTFKEDGTAAIPQQLAAQVGWGYNWDRTLVPSRQYWEYVEWQHARHQLRPFSARVWEEMYLYQKAARVHLMMCQYALCSKHLEHPQVPPRMHPAVLDLVAEGMTRWDTPMVHHPALVEEHEVLPPLGDLRAHLLFLSTKLIRMHINSLDLIYHRSRNAAPANRGGGWHMEPLLNPLGITFTQLMAKSEVRHGFSEQPCWRTPLEQRWWYMGEEQPAFMEGRVISLVDSSQPLTLAQRNHVWRMVGAVQFLTYYRCMAEMYPDEQLGCNINLRFSHLHCNSRAVHRIWIREFCYYITCIAFGLPPDQQRAALQLLLPKDYPHLDQAFEVLITKPTKILDPVLQGYA
jgi:hypothetical protein